MCIGQDLVHKWLLDNPVRLKATCLSLVKCCNFDPVVARMLFRSTSVSDKRHASLSEGDQDESKVDSAARSKPSHTDTSGFTRIPTGLSALDDRGYKEVAKVARMLGGFSYSSSLTGTISIVAFFIPCDCL